MTTFDLLIGRDSGRAKSCRTRSRSRTREAQNGVGVGRDENSRDSIALVLCHFNKSISESDVFNQHLLKS